MQLDHYVFGATFMELLGDRECEVSHDFVRHLAAEPLQKLMANVPFGIMEVLRKFASPGDANCEANQSASKSHCTMEVVLLAFVASAPGFILVFAQKLSNP